MKVVVLPGYSIKNKDWAIKIKKEFNTEFKVVVYEWKHWESGGSLSIKSEVENIIEVVAKENVNFIAKSVGTRVLMSVIPKIINQIDKIILCGIPMNPKEYVKSLKLIDPAKLLVFQNTGDPFMPYGAIKMYLKLVNKNIKVIEGKRNDHDYPFFEDFKKFLR